MPRPQLSHFILFCFFSDAETLWAVTQLRLVIPKYPTLISSSVFSGWDAGSSQPSSRRTAVQPKRDAWSVSQEAAEQQQQPEEEKKKTKPTTKNQEPESDGPGRRPHISTRLASHLRSRGEPNGRTKTPTIFGHVSPFLQIFLFPTSILYLFHFLFRFLSRPRRQTILLVLFL